MIHLFAQDCVLQQVRDVLAIGLPLAIDDAAITGWLRCGKVHHFLRCRLLWEGEQNGNEGKAARVCWGGSLFWRAHTHTQTQLCVVDAFFQ